MKVRAVDFVALEVSDMDRAIAFYKDVLGLPLEYTYEQAWAEFAAGDDTLALMAKSNDSGDGQATAPTGHLALAVENVDQAVAELKEKDVEILSGPHDTPVCHIATLADPDGNRILIHHRKDGTFG